MTFHLYASTASSWAHVRAAQAVSRLVLAICVLCTAGPAAADGDVAESAQERFECAMELYRTQRFAGAFGRLAQLADQGHAEAARIAWMMVRHGKALYGSEWEATPMQWQRWSEVVLLDARRVWSGMPDR